MSADGCFRAFTAGHHFLLRALPIRADRSRTALARFGLELKTCGGTPAEIEAALVRCLAVLDDRSSLHPRAVQLYVSAARYPGDIETFREIAERVILRDDELSSKVHDALIAIHQGFGDSTLCISEMLCKNDSEATLLNRRFKAKTGLSIGRYIRALRLETAAALLLDLSLRIKDIWVRVGYASAYAFNHDFRTRFGRSPTDLRQKHRQAIAAVRLADVLIVDDDPGTRECVSQHLLLQRISAYVARNGEAGLQLGAEVRPAVVLLDYHLPDMTAGDWLIAWRRIMTCHSHVLLFTADWTVCDSNQWLALGAQPISKLSDIESVIELIRGHLEVSDSIWTLPRLNGRNGINP